ncbi:MAG: FimV/HubP family polar landmark protein, partial [Marinobacter sp.]|nr:FimV/HubP family polar landmark protein [Marinobacter sp.]
MKVRKLAVALAVAGGLGSSVVQALGLGEVELQSYLNEPLNAEIALLKTEGVSPDNIIVELASEQSYKRLGLSRNFFLSNLKFNVTTAPNGQLVIDVTSREPVREPYLDFLIEVTWPSGRLMREYSVLVDPPVYAEKSGLKDQVQAPAAASVSPATQNRGRTSPQRTSATSSAGSVSGGTFGPTGVSDTLWGIASQVRPNDQVTQQQTMLAIQDLNPDAFIDGNINRLKRGEVLRIPTLSQIQQRSQAQANREVRAQNQA